MKHLINHKEVEIDWDKQFIIDNHDSGCQDWAIKGEGDDGKTYVAQGFYLSGELEEVTEIEEYDN